MLICTQASPQALAASSRASSVPVVNVVASRMPICGDSGSTAFTRFCPASGPDRDGPGQVKEITSATAAVVSRHGLEPDYRNFHFGLRVVLSIHPAAFLRSCESRSLRVALFLRERSSPSQGGVVVLRTP